MTKVAIILPSESNFPLAQKLKESIRGSQIYTKAYIDDTEHIISIEDCVKDQFSKVNSFIFIDAVSTCVQTFAPYMVNIKEDDPALVCVDNTGKFVISILMGYNNTGNLLTKRVAHALGAFPIITTHSESENLWSLETLGERFGWVTDTNSASFNYPQISFINRRPTALLLDIQDQGTLFFEHTVPDHVTIYYKYEDIILKDYELLIAVTPYVYPDAGIQIIYYHPKVLNIGISCREYKESDSFPKDLAEEIRGMNISLESIRTIASADSKDDTMLLTEFKDQFKDITVLLYNASELQTIEKENVTSNGKHETLTVANIAEATALKSSDNGEIVVNKQKAIMNIANNDYTFAIAIDNKAIRRGHIEIVGAGPGDPDLISIKGKYFIETADLILYSETQIDVSFTYAAKNGVVVCNLDIMTEDEQANLVEEYYKMGKLIVRLSVGDPCIYGSIQEHLEFFDKHKMSYHITPGIASFSAAAAALETQFTSNQTETIILTRNITNSLMPTRQSIQDLAKSQSTMCIFLSAPMAEDIQRQLLIHYPPETPVAVCYRITWQDEHIYRGQLQDLAKIVSDNNLVTKTLIIVGEAIGNREGLSKLYANRFKHLLK